jgi:polyisoprenoid-binding protein YceI
MGPDFLDAANHPTAVFQGDIAPATDGYAATGTLTIRGVALPLTLPFSLALTGDTAEMRAVLTLDRRAFGIGDNLNDEASLGFSVTVRVTLKAERGT